MTRRWVPFDKRDQYRGKGRMRAVRLLVGMLAAFVLVVGCAIAAEPVDLLLVLASDVSLSINDTKFKLQRDGYIAAITNPRVIDVIRSGPQKRIGVCFVEWSGSEEQKVVIDWTLIESIQDAKDFVDKLGNAPRSFSNFTSISAGIDFAVAQLEGAPFSSERRTIDVSGDGTSNRGRDVIAAREDAVAKGVTINGLVILTELPLEWDPSHTHPPGGLEDYYRENVVGGPHSFVKVAQTFDAFGQAILSKLITEIADSHRPLERKFAEITPKPSTSHVPIPHHTEGGR
jgi:hypothetical protein